MIETPEGGADGLADGGLGGVAHGAESGAADGGLGGIGGRAVAAARGWIGTPYRHQASCRGAGSDCLGLLRGIWRELYGAEPEVPGPYTVDWGEPQGREILWGAARRHLREKPLAAAAAGDVLLFRMRDAGIAKHLGIQGRVDGAASFIHAYSGHAVVESPLSAPWARRVVARFALPEGEN